MAQANSTVFAKESPRGTPAVSLHRYIDHDPGADELKSWSGVHLRPILLATASLVTYLLCALAVLVFPAAQRQAVTYSTKRPRQAWPSPACWVPHALWTLYGAGKGCVLGFRVARGFNSGFLPDAFASGCKQACIRNALKHSPVHEKPAGNANPQVSAGVDRGTMRSISKYGYGPPSRPSRQAQVSRGLINHHFGSKEELIGSPPQGARRMDIPDPLAACGNYLEPEDKLQAMIRVSFGPAMFKQEYLGIWAGFWSAIEIAGAARKLNRGDVREGSRDLPGGSSGDREEA
jgi:hypothetical protein